MRAVLLPGDKRVTVVDRPVPQPGPGQVLVRTVASAICRSDMSIYYGAPVLGESRGAEALIIPGHEAAGVVVATGADAGSVRVGDRVAAFLAVAPTTSTFHDSGLWMLDDEWQCFGFDLDGGDAEFFVVPHQNCLPLPDRVSFKAGAVLTDMVGTQFSTQKRLGVTSRDTVVVTGLGPMGAAAVLVAKGFGATVIAVDVLDSRLAQARALGADHTLNSSTDDVLAAARALTGGRGPRVVIECSGNPAAQNTALDVAAKLGSVALVGESRETLIRPSEQFLRKLLTVVGGWYFSRNDWEEIVAFVVDNDVPVEKLISHEFSIEQAEEAFSAFDRRETEKAVFTFPESKDS